MSVNDVVEDATVLKSSFWDDLLRQLEKIRAVSCTSESLSINFQDNWLRYRCIWASTSSSVTRHDICQASLNSDQHVETRFVDWFNFCRISMALSLAGWSRLLYIVSSRGPTLRVMCRLQLHIIRMAIRYNTSLSTLPMLYDNYPPSVSICAYNCTWSFLCTAFRTVSCVHSLMHRQTLKSADLPCGDRVWHFVKRWSKTCSRLA